MGGKESAESNKLLFPRSLKKENRLPRKKRDSHCYAWLGCDADVEEWPLMRPIRVD